MTIESSNTKDEDTTSPAISRTAFLGVLGLVCLCVLVLVMIARKPTQEQKEPSQIAHIHQEYQYILSEPHTGLRLTRYLDFMVQYPNSADIAAVRVQYSALKIHETRVWATLSETVYDLSADADAKNYAKNVYIAQWGTLIRQDKLQTLPIAPPKTSTDALTFKTAKSSYAKGRDANTLAGAKTGKSKNKRKKNETTKNKTDNDNTVPARIRYARKPIYPRNARRRGINATVSLSLTIDKRGRVIRTKVLDVNASRYEENFIRAARHAAKRSRFRPKTISGKPVMVRNYKRIYRFNARD